MSSDHRQGSETPDAGLQLIAEGITSLVGFGVCAINLVRGDELEVVALAGVTTARTPDGHLAQATDILGTRWAVSDLEIELAKAEDWGLFKFVPAEPDHPPTREGFWITQPQTSNHPDAWQPLDQLLAPLRDDSGRLVGVLSIDAPDNGLRPDARQRRILERFAEQARDAVLLTLERERLAQRAHHQRLAQAFLRNVTAMLPLEDVIAAVGEALLDALDADGLRLHARGPEGEAVAFGTEGVDWVPPASSMVDAASAAEEAWRSDTFMFTDRAGVADHPGLGKYRDTVLDVMDRAGAEHFLMVPLGIEDEALGQLVVIRRPGRPAWTTREGRLAMELARDLGQLVLRSNAYSRERDLVAQLRATDQEQSRLIEALVREIERPLAELDDALADVRVASQESPRWRAALEAMTRSADGLVGVVENLLMLARLSDGPEVTADSAPVDLVPLLATVHDALAGLGDARGVTSSLEVPPSPAYVAGEMRELESAILHLVTNAISFTPAGGRVSLRLDVRDGEVVVSVADTGIGIPSAEQAAVFREFVRGSDPVVQATPGAGLGLTIVSEVAARHDARVELESTPGVGTTVRLILPVAD